ncbi:hypothetical protein D3C83_44910 [compost metagenome]
MGRSSSGNKRVVGGTANDTLVGQIKNKLPVILGAQPQVWPGKSRRQKISHYIRRSPMRRRQTGQHRIGFQRAALDQLEATIKRFTRGSVVLMPGGEGRND